MISIELKKDLECRSFEGYSKGGPTWVPVSQHMRKFGSNFASGRAKESFRLGSTGHAAVSGDSWKNCSKHQCFSGKVLL